MRKGKFSLRQVGMFFGSPLTMVIPLPSEITTPVKVTMTDRTLKKLTRLSSPRKQDGMISKYCIGIRARNMRCRLKSVLMAQTSLLLVALLLAALCLGTHRRCRNIGLVLRIY